MSGKKDDLAIVRALRRENDALTEENRHLKTGGGDGTSGDVNGDWKDSVNTQLTQLHSDVRNLLYGLIGLAILLAGAGFGLYSGLSDQITDMKIEQGKILTKLDILLDKDTQPSSASPKQKESE